MRAARVPPSGVDFFNTLKEITLLEETGKPQMLFWEAQNASGRQADIRTLPDAFFTEKSMRRGMNRIIRPNAFRTCDLLAL